MYMKRSFLSATDPGVIDLLTFVKTHALRRRINAGLFLDEKARRSTAEFGDREQCGR